jgi:Family of unknown function (DUF6292)
VTSLVGFDSDVERHFSVGLLGYLDAVAFALGVGLESCAVDLDVPASAYMALDWSFGRFPGRDMALTWDERYGWAAAADAVGGAELIVLAYLGGSEVVPEPAVLAQFLAALGAGDLTLGRPDPPNFRDAGDHGVLLAQLERHRRVH